MTFARLVSRLRLPVMAAPMFICSGPELVLAQCRAGIVGSFPALNARPASQLGDWLGLIRDELAAHDEAHPDAPSAPFAVNQIVHRSNGRLEQDMAVIAEHRVPIVITSLGARSDVNDAVHSYGGIVLHDVVNNEFARKAVDKGADGIIAVAAGAGGHAGTLSPFALVQEIRAWFEGPLLLSGAIANGRSVLAATVAGADLAYVGSAFLATHEARTSETYRELLRTSSAKDIVYTNAFTGVHGNYLRGSIENAGLDPDDLSAERLNRPPVGGEDAEARAWRDIWGAGQGVGIVSETRSAAAVIDELRAEFDHALRGLVASSY